ncbi:hypothetical protein FRC17_006861, partial [Serendipita sp. 399]
FDWFAGSDNPTVNWKAVQCPSALTNISGCTRNSQAGGAPGTGGTTQGGGGGPTSTRNNGGGGSGAPLY